MPKEQTNRLTKEQLLKLRHDSWLRLMENYDHIERIVSEMHGKIPEKEKEKDLDFMIVGEVMSVALGELNLIKSLKMNESIWKDN